MRQRQLLQTEELGWRKWPAEMNSLPRAFARVLPHFVRERERLAWGSLQCFGGDVFEDAVQVSIDFFVRYPDLVPTFTLQMLTSAGVAGLCFIRPVGGAIDFDDEPDPGAREIGEIGADGVLAAEPEAVQLVALQA